MVASWSISWDGTSEILALFVKTPSIPQISTKIKTTQVVVTRKTTYFGSVSRFDKKKKTKFKTITYNLRGCVSKKVFQQYYELS